MQAWSPKNWMKVYCPKASKLAITLEMISDETKLLFNDKASRMKL